MSDATSAEELLGIIELGAVCAAMRARNVALFEQLGNWVADTTDPGLQRLFAEACHRHAWHAELWAQRTPDIGVGTTTIGVVATEVVATTDRAGTYSAAIERLIADTAALTDRLDALLDPSTTRTIGLVLTDLAELRQRLAAADSP